MRDIEVEGGANLGFIQHGEGGALDLAGELIAMAGIHYAGAAGQLADGYGEVIPGAHAFVAVVVHALGGFGGVQNGADGICQVAGIGGGAHLVEHHVEARAAGHEAEHGLHEVLAVNGVKPGGADDDAAAATGEDGLLTFQLGAAIGPQRAGWHIFGARGVSLAAEHVVRAHMDEQGAFCLGGRCQIGSGCGIDEVGYLFVILGGVHIGVGSAVHDGAHALGGFEHGGSIGNIQLCHIGEDELMLAAQLSGYAAHFIAQLAVGTCNKNFHDSVERDGDIEIVRGGGQGAAGGVLGGKDDICGGQLPIDAEGGVIPGDTAFAIRGVVVITLVLEDGLLTEHSKAVGKTARNEELAVVLCTEFHSDMLAIGRGTLADIHRHIEHTALHTTHELALAVRGALVVQPAQYAVAGHGFIVLNKSGVADFFAEFAVGEGFVEITARITEHAGFDDDDSGDGRGDDVHLLFFLALRAMCIRY